MHKSSRESPPPVWALLLSSLLPFDFLASSSQKYFGDWKMEISSVSWLEKPELWGVLSRLCWKSVSGYPSLPCSLESTLSRLDNDDTSSRDVEDSPSEWGSSQATKRKQESAAEKDQAGNTHWNITWLYTSVVIKVVVGKRWLPSWCQTTMPSMLWQSVAW